MARSWVQKLADETPHVIKRMTIDIAGMKKGEIVLVPSIRQIDEFIRAIPRRRYVSIADMRKELARLHGAEVTCPVYTGYHLRTCAEAAFETYSQGAPLTRITPVWRVLDEKSPTIKKLSAKNQQMIKEQRQREGL